MEERRRGGFRVKPSYGQVLGYIQEGEPLALDLPKRNASIYTSSHWYLDDYPNAPEPVSETPLPHTSINPAAAFETADEGYDGVPFPRPPREFTRPSFLPDSDDGGTDPGQALRNDGLDPPRPPTLGGRMRESGIQAAEAIVVWREARRARRQRCGACRRTRRCWPCEVAATGWTGPFASRGAHRDWPPHRTKCLRRKLSDGPRKWGALLQRAGQRAAEVERQAAQDIERFASQQMHGGGASAAEAAGAATGGLVAAGTAWAIEGGVNAASHMLGWGAETGGGTDSDASRPSRATDVQTLNGMQESGAIDHFFAQQLRRQPQGRQQPTPFGINQVPIPVSSGSERSRISRQSRGDRGPLATPSFDALRTASEPEAA